MTARACVPEPPCDCLMVRSVPVLALYCADERGVDGAVELARRIVGDVQELERRGARRSGSERDADEQSQGQTFQHGDLHQAGAWPARVGMRDVVVLASGFGVSRRTRFNLESVRLVTRPPSRQKKGPGGWTSRAFGHARSTGAQPVTAPNAARPWAREIPGHSVQQQQLAFGNIMAAGLCATVRALSTRKSRMLEDRRSMRVRCHDLRYRLRTSRMTPMSRRAYKPTACFTFDNMGEAADVGAGRLRGAACRPGATLRSTVGFPRLFRLLAAHAVRATFFVEGWNGVHHPEAVAEIVAPRARARHARVGARAVGRARSADASASTRRARPRRSPTRAASAPSAFERREAAGGP